MNFATSRAFPKFESYGMLETAASRGWKAKDAIEWFHGIDPLVEEADERDSDFCCGAHVCSWHKAPDSRKVSLSRSMPPALPESRESERRGNAEETRPIIPNLMSA